MLGFRSTCHFSYLWPGGNFGWPSQSRLRRASVSAAASGAVCQWQTSSTDRRGSGDRPLGNVPPGRSGPQGGSQVSPPPLGEVSCLWHDGEGNLPTARTCVSDSHRRGVQPPVSPAGSVSPERSPLGTRTPRREMRAQALGRFARPPARTCAILSHRRGVQPPPLGANCPVRSRTAK